MKLWLAPMEGVVDFTMRRTLTAIGGIDHCVTEFIRVTSTLLPESVFLRDCPELKTKSQTASGVPVLVQLLGSDPSCLAENAARACELGAPGVDLNFGCPAKTVNRHHGGASVLRHPELLQEIVEKVRQAVPSNKSVSAKIRLGYDDPTTCLRTAEACESAGASWITVHCRTKTNGYAPPAFWEWIPKIKEVVSLPVIANGEIWTLEDLHRCERETGCDQFMIGRGAIADPFLFQKIRNPNLPAATWSEHLQLLIQFFQDNEASGNSRLAMARCKQWLRQWQRHHLQAVALFNDLKVLEQPEVFYARASTSRDFENIEKRQIDMLQLGGSF